MRAVIYFAWLLSARRSLAILASALAGSGLVAGCQPAVPAIPVRCTEPPVGGVYTFDCEGVPVTEEQFMTACGVQTVECRTDLDGTHVGACLRVEDRGSGLAELVSRRVECIDDEVVLGEDLPLP